MDSKNHIPPHAVENLLKYLPLFRNHKSEQLVTLHPPRELEDGTTHFGYYTYHQVVRDFFKEIYEHWIAKDYLSHISPENLQQKNWIRRAGMDELRLAFTFLVRSERFSEGSWAAAIKEGVIVRLLERLQELQKL